MSGDEIYNGTSVGNISTALDSSSNASQPRCYEGLWSYGPEFMILKYAVDVVIMPLVILGGTTGNILSFWVLQAMKGTSTTLVLQALAVADTFYLFNCFSFQTLKTLYSYDANFARLFPTFPYWEARVAWPLANTSQTMAVWLVVLLTAERYCAICFPLKSKQMLTPRKNCIWIISVCILALVFNAPTHLDLRVYDLPIKGCPNTRPKEAMPTRLYMNFYYTIIYKTLGCLVFRTLGPLCVLIALNVRVVKEIEASKVETNQVTSRTSNNMNEIVVIVVCAFLVCQTPVVIFEFLRAIKFFVPTFAIDWKTFAFLGTFTNLLVALNSAINFLLYCFSGGRFRQILRKKLACAKRHSVSDGTRARTTSRTMETFLSLISTPGGSRNASTLDIAKGPQEQSVPPVQLYNKLVK